MFSNKKIRIKIGTETFCSQMQDIVFENNVVIESRSCHGINVRDGAIVQDVILEITMQN